MMTCRESSLAYLGEVIPQEAVPLPVVIKVRRGEPQASKE